MGSPQPLEGHNPYTGMYQKRQFGVGNLSSTPNLVSDYMQSPPAALVTAEGQTPLVEQAEFWNLTPQVITVTGSPAAGTFTLAWGATVADTSIAKAASNTTVQTSIRTIAALNAVTVTGPNGGPWTVSGSQLSGQLLSVASNNLTGGTNPKVLVTSPAEQPGIEPF